MGYLDGIIRRTVPIPLHHIQGVGRYADVPHRFVDNIGVLDNVLVFVGVFL